MPRALHPGVVASDGSAASCAWAGAAAASSRARSARTMEEPVEALLDRVLAANSAHVALGLEADATADEHHKAWKKLVLKCHPDKCLDHKQKATEATQHMHALFERERNRHRTHRREPERPPARASPRWPLWR